MARIPTLIEDPRTPGRIIGVNIQRINEIPYWLTTDRPNNIVTVPANQSSPLATLTVSGQGPARIVSLAHQKTGACLMFLRVQDGTTPRGLMNGAIHIDCICGNGIQPYYLPEALYVDELRSLQVTYTNLTAAPNNIRLAALSSRFLTQQADPSMERIRKRMETRQYLSMPYWYTFDGGFQTIGAGIGTVLNAPITVGQDHHFQLFCLSAVSTGLFDIDIIDANTGESLIQAPGDNHYAVGSDVLIGTGNFPYRFHEPRLFQYGQKLIVQLINRIAGANTVHLALGGRALAIRMWG